MNLQYKNLIIRDAVAADAEQLTVWWNDGAVMAHAGFPNGLGTTVEKVIAGLGNGRLVLEENGRLIGEACYRKVDDGIAEIGIKICETDCQNRGLGRIILSMLISSSLSRVLRKSYWIPTSPISGHNMCMNLWVFANCG